MSKFKELFGEVKPVIGMVHVEALPGTPNSTKTVGEIIELAIEETKIYRDCGVHSVMIENMHDVPYLKRNVGPEITAAMSVIGYEVKNACDLPCGIQILAGANKEAMAAAIAAGLDFIRAEGFVFAHTADEGIIESDAGELLRFRKAMDAENIAIFTDIKKKHSSHALTSDTDLIETANAAKFFKSDGLIITGKATGAEADMSELFELYSKCDLPILIGSGITNENLQNYFELADGFIVGSHFKDSGKWDGSLGKERIERFLKRYNEF
ncbi:MAG: BtpA/SgcQ family protein [Melioribacteraceae bacterium]|nr:BtpA/SgcQ family protein [Melioribacteraceae bacterium]MCF8263465.1 BtpA/SgcQ family protein [Melioribacteraceae bacterium]MCF8431261.1 BtpA/SgcQ family protein [Melioribacteraceae bacterium]